MVAELIVQDEVEGSTILCPVPAVEEPLFEPPTVWNLAENLASSSAPKSVRTDRHVECPEAACTPAVSEDVSGIERSVST